MEVLIIIDQKHLEELFFSKKSKILNRPLLMNNLLLYKVNCLKNTGWEEVIITSLENLSVDQNAVFSKFLIKINKTYEYLSEKRINPSLILKHYQNTKKGILQSRLILFSLNFFFQKAFFYDLYTEVNYSTRKIKTEKICSKSRQEIKRPNTLIAENKKEIVEKSNIFFQKGKEIVIAKSDTGIKSEEIFLLTPSNLKKTIKQDIFSVKSFVIQEFIHIKKPKVIFNPPLIRVHVSIYSWNPLKYEILPYKFVRLTKPFTKKELDSEDFQTSKKFSLSESKFILLREYITSKKGENIKEVDLSLKREIKKILRETSKNIKKETSKCINYLGFDFLLIENKKGDKLQFLEMESSPLQMASRKNILHLSSYYKKNLELFFKTAREKAKKNSPYPFKKEKAENIYWIRMANEHLKDPSEKSLEKAHFLLQKALENGSILALKTINLLLCQLAENDRFPERWGEIFFQHLTKYRKTEIEKFDLYLSGFFLKTSYKNWIIPYLLHNFNTDCSKAHYNIIVSIIVELRCLDILKNKRKYKNKKHILAIIASHYLNLNPSKTVKSIKEKKLTLELYKLYSELIYTYKSNPLDIIEISIIFSSSRCLDIYKIIFIEMEKYLSTNEVDSPILLQAIQHLESSHTSEKISSDDLLDLYDLYGNFLLRKNTIFDIYKSLHYFLKIQKNKKDPKILEKIYTIYALISKKWRDGDQGCKDESISSYYQNQFIKSKSPVSNIDA